MVNLPSSDEDVRPDEQEGRRDEQVVRPEEQAVRPNQQEVRPDELELRPDEQEVRPIAERRSEQPPPVRSYSRFRRNRRGHQTVMVEPTGLQQLEALSNKMVAVMEKYPYNPPNESNFVKVMDLLRCQYNLNFIVLCEKCGGIHRTRNDELVAPER
ncbi:unnamed protein product [Diatraea saccharalis]|uniref:Uncharacterized protein n=1 Tax=Diatraea saccharalis TaxID=40085 RepID=A0A9N9RHY0_9NEOP|nr:unnamed protein product [Diatraea saccharalis]